jgi:hypothetical protein
MTPGSSLNLPAGKDLRRLNGDGSRGTIAGMAGATLRITIPEPLADAVSAESFRQGRSVSDVITALLTEVLPTFVAQRMAHDLDGGAHAVDATTHDDHPQRGRAQARRRKML